MHYLLLFEQSVVKTTWPNCCVFVYISVLFFNWKHFQYEPMGSSLRATKRLSNAKSTVSVTQFWFWSFHVIGRQQQKHIKLTFSIH